MMAGKPGEIDPTNPDRDGTGVDDSDDADETTTTSFPSESSAENIRRLEERHKALKDDIDTMKIPSISKFNLRNPEEVREYINDAKRFIRARFPTVDEKLLNAISFATQPNTKNRLVVVGLKGGEQLIFNVDETAFIQGFISKYTFALGPDAERIIAKLNAQKRQSQQQRQGIQETIELEDLGLKRKKAELQKLQEKRKRAQAKLDQLQKEEDGDNEDDASTSLLDKRKEDITKWEQLIKNYDQDIKKQQTEIDQHSKTQAQDKAKGAQLQTQISTDETTRDTLESRLNATKSLDELREHDAELEWKNAEDQQILDDENATSSEKEAARERIEERNEERARLRPQIQEREQARPLRERIREIFKKYGWTLQAIVLAAGIVISAVVLATLNGLAKATKAIGNGLKELGKKAAAALPGLIGSIVGFIFKTAGSVISFLGKHAWLIILAVVAFLVERVTKRAR